MKKLLFTIILGYEKQIIFSQSLCEEKILSITLN